MKIELERVKSLVESGDTTSLNAYILASLEKSDVVVAANTNAEVKSFLDSEKDKHHGTALETWKSNHLQGLLDEAVSKANPSETPEQKQIRELTERIEQKDKAEAQFKMKEDLLSYAKEKQFDLGFAAKHGHLFLGEDLEASKEAFGAFNSEIDAIVQSKVEATLKGNARNNPGGSTGAGSGGESFGKQLAKQTVQEPTQSNYF